MLDFNKTYELSPEEKFLSLRNDGDREIYWPEFAKLDFLYCALDSLVQKLRLPDEANEWLDSCEHYARVGGSLKQWEQAQIYLWVALYSREIVKEQNQQKAEPNKKKNANKLINEDIEYVINEDKFKRDFLAFSRNNQDYENIALGCYRSFCSKPVHIAPTLVPVVLADEPGSGYLTTLVLEILQAGKGQVFHHPMDAFIMDIGEDFDDSMVKAWKAAKGLLQKEADSLANKDDAANKALLDKVNGRWRLLKRWLPEKEKADEVPEKRVDGSSAGAAAAWGWYHALKGTAYDPRVIVSAEIDDDSNKLNGVEYIPAKIKAITEDNRFDTFVVASTENKKQAVDTLLNGSDVELKPKPPDNESPGWKYFVPLTDGRELKIVNLDPDDPCATEKS